MTHMPQERARHELARMVDAIAHESFYTKGMWADESLGIYVGWVAQKGAFSDGMPVCNEGGEVVLVFSGEDYPEPGTAQHLKERGHTLNLDGPSYLVHQYEEDSAFPVGLNGMFHGIVIDHPQRTATLFNDRFGMHRLYYHEAKEGFYFAAEAKAILAARPGLRVADSRGLGEFVALGCVLENRTIFQGIELLPQASAWVFKNAVVARKSVYFQPREWEDQVPLEPEAYYLELRDVLSRNLPRYFNGRERIGIALTGGLDTRAIMAWRKPQPGSLPCYTFGSKFRECEDVRIARRIAGVCQQSHQTLEVGNKFLSRFPHYAERSVYLTEGGVGVYHASDLYVSERARQIAPVKVVGTYGSEIVRHTVMLSPKARARGLYRPEFVTHINTADDTCADVQREHPVTFAAFRQSPWYHHGILGLEQTQLTVRSPYLDNDFVRTVYRSPQSAGICDDIRPRLIHDGDPRLGRIRTDRGVGGEAGPLTTTFTRALLEFTVKAEYAYDYGMPQWLARIDHLLSPLHLERLFLGRHKMSHFRVWYRDALSHYVREMLLDARTLNRPYLERPAVESVVEAHLKGDRNYTSEIHQVLTLELLHRTFFD